MSCQGPIHIWKQSSVVDRKENWCQMALGVEKNRSGMGAKTRSYDEHLLRRDGRQWVGAQDPGAQGALLGQHLFK